MAQVTEYRDIRLDDLVIGQGQVRTQSPGKEVDDLARSIEVQGLLQPIVVCPARQDGKWEILVGQRRFLAHKILERETITAAVLDERVAAWEAKAISITENIIRRKLSGPELKDGILFLHKHYGTITDIVSATGLPEAKVRDNIKYPRLIQELKDLVDEATVDVNAALRAQDAATDDDGQINRSDAVVLAREMSLMSGAQRKKLEQERRSNPKTSIAELIENAKTSSKVVQVVTTLTKDVHNALRRFATEQRTNQDEAAAELIGRALVEHGLLDD